MPPPKTVTYDEDVDFAALALKDSDFAKVLDDKGKLDFRNPICVKQLTKSLLKRDFGLTLELPDDRLCPPVPVRFNYIRWLQDLIDTTSESYTDTYDPSREVMGIDIGVGASCIYPLLACASRPKWLMGGSELDPKNFAYAKQNVVANNLQQRIRLVSVAPSSRKDDMTPPVLPLNALGIQRADFVMCNPPFYRSREELRTAQAAKNAPPSAVCTGADVEMVCEGGDEGFVLRMVEESSDAMMRHRVRWFSSMLGKWASVEVVVANLKERGVDNWAVRSLMGEKMRTQRWAVAWSYGDLRPRADVARRDTASSLAPFPPKYVITFGRGGAESVKETIGSALSGLDMQWHWADDRVSGFGFAKENVWSRAARRKRKREIGNPDLPIGEPMEEDESDHIALGIKITISKEQVDIRWLKGRDSVLFESFCGMLRRAVSQGRNG